ncbi:MAG: bifunctional riboflavin kinase/FAD synthetase [Gammaproteobacteria bacterium]|nr:bifunctional riboflavin kinase/FAD synthetase [Gammaproteobacteria bacterium]
MQLLRRPNASRGRLGGGCVATIGVFDGVHVGHQKIIDRLRTVAAQRGLPSLLFTFEPTPREYFSGSNPPARLSRWREKFTAVERLGVDWMYCPRFDCRLELLTPAAFIESLLVGHIGVRHLVVGDDFRFGHRRAGTVADLEAAGPLQGFTLEHVGSVAVDGERVSSTAVREALAVGDLDRARRLLGRSYSMTGRVVRGRMLGRELGMPTANVNLHRRQSPLHGIFAVQVAGLGAARRPGVASVGTRPTVDGGAPLLEVHLFDFDQDIYGALLEVEFIARLRDEVRFPDLATLKEQMHRDADDARRILNAA